VRVPKSISLGMRCNPPRVCIRNRNHAKFETQPSNTLTSRCMINASLLVFKFTSPSNLPGVEEVKDTLMTLSL